MAIRTSLATLQRAMTTGLAHTVRVSLVRCHADAATWHGENMPSEHRCARSHPRGLVRAALGGASGAGVDRVTESCALEKYLLSQRGNSAGLFSFPSGRALVSKRGPPGPASPLPEATSVA